MNTGLISIRYAKALFLFAKKENALEQVYQSAKLLSTIFETMPQLHSVLDNPFVAKEEKQKLIQNAAGKNRGKTFDKFTDMIIKNGREHKIQEIAYKFIEIYRKDQQILHGKLITAVPISSLVEQDLKALVKQEGILELEQIINPNILGGFILEVEHKRWDASISNQLNKIKQEYKEQNRRII